MKRRTNLNKGRSFVEDQRRRDRIAFRAKRDTKKSPNDVAGKKCENRKLQETEREKEKGSHK